jgi:hypothetical protein
VDAWFAREVAVEYKDFVDEILEESPEAIQMTTDNSLAIGRDSHAISGKGSNANSRGGPNANNGGLRPGTVYEYVGHLVSATGTSFISEKRLKVLDFPQPTTQKEMPNSSALRISSEITFRT